jgi:hypothetical protein
LIQSVADFGETLLNAGQCVAVDTGLAAFGDTLRQALDLPLDRIDRLARHRVAQ